MVRFLLLTLFHPQPEKIRTCIAINKELASYPDTQKRTERAYSLPKGGIALHLKEKEEAGSCKKN